MRVTNKLYNSMLIQQYKGTIQIKLLFCSICCHGCAERRNGPFAACDRTSCLGYIQYSAVV